MQLLSHAHRRADTLLDSSFALELAREGYRKLCIRAGAVCGLYSFNFTTGLVVGLTPDGYERRYCYARVDEAIAALAGWDGQGHPGGPWIKCKGAGIDLLNPSFGVS